jgi:hypothetical protein
VTEEELYDIGEQRETDPNEWNNLANDPEYAPVMEYMRQFLLDSAHYKERMFAVNIANTNTLPCFVKNTGKIKLQGQLYDLNGTLLTGTGYTFTWTNSLTPAVVVGKNYTFNMTTIPPATYSANDHIMFYLKVTDNATGSLVAFNTRTYYINNANTPGATYSLINDVTGLTTTVNAYTISGSYNNTYWDFGDGSTSEELIPDTHYYAAPGLYTVRNYIQYGNGCVKNVARYANLLRTGEPQFEFSLFPNPANTSVHIALPHAAEDFSVQVYNMLGQLMFSKQIAQANENVTVDITGLAPGTYLVVLQSETFYGSKPLEVMR